VHLKTYRARSMAECLAQVKKDLGKDAVILHTRTYHMGGVMGVGGHQEFEITAADSAVARGPGLKETKEATRTEGVSREVRAVGGRAAITAMRVSTPTEAEAFVPAGFTSIGEGKRNDAIPSGREQDERGDDRADDRGVVTTVPKVAQAAQGGKGSLGMAGAEGARTLATRVAPAPVDDSAMKALHEELGSIRRIVGQILTHSRSTTPFGVLSPLTGLSDPLVELHARLQEAGVLAETCEALIGSVRDELTPDELRDEPVCRATVLRHLAKRLACVGSVSKAGLTREGRPLTIALVGPTGVGKTTTIAKLAAVYKLRHGAKVGLVTSDTYRIAAVEQLRTYASIIQVPLKVALTPEELSAACEAMRDCGVILVDTAGRSQHDSSRLEELREFTIAAQAHETHLVLSAAQAENAMRASAERFGVLAPTSVIFSKLDEAVSFGALVNVCGGLRISYVTTGQEVPDHMELGNADRLARLVLDGRLRRAGDADGAPQGGSQGSSVICATGTEGAA
jgi:flagellar biosynthesis protein FlhF